MEGEGPHSAKKQKVDPAVVSDVKEQSDTTTSSSSLELAVESGEPGEWQPPDVNPCPLDFVEDISELDEAEKIECHQAMIDEARSAAKLALESYNKAEGVEYELETPLLSFCFLLDRVFICHANFTAKKRVVIDNDSSDSPTESIPPRSQLFFAETAQGFGTNTVVTCCDIVDTSSGSGGFRDGCLYCWRGGNPVFYHPCGQKFKYGWQSAFQ
ncbi:unnamed protein product [Linum tenue]|uniref:DUF3615 domain-containing protein n=1 Tax=Linum tenue TaxID=586396 RepID=A0AAV0LT65_9ROSI|nr:unnamed protein product [Linum tenue]